MPFDPTLPLADSEMRSAEMRAQIHQLKALIDDQAAGLASLTTRVAALESPPPGPYTATRVLAIRMRTGFIPTPGCTAAGRSTSIRWLRHVRAGDRPAELLDSSPAAEREHQRIVFLPDHRAHRPVGSHPRRTPPAGTVS